MEVILLPFDSTESDGKLQLWKLGAHLSITRINSELHEFMKLFQNIKKIKKKSRMSAQNISTSTKISILICSHGSPYTLQ